MTPESITFIVLATWLVGAVTLLLFGSWLIRRDLNGTTNMLAPRLFEDLRPLQNLVVDYFALTEPSARLLTVLATHPRPLPIRTSEGTGGAGPRHSPSEWIALSLMRLAGLIRVKKRFAWVTEVGLEVHRRITAKLSSEPEDQRKSIYDSLFVPGTMDNSGAEHMQRVREAMRGN